MPFQGFLNALAYGWTRGDFRKLNGVQRNDSIAAVNSYGAVGGYEETASEN